jgi:aconitate hydratase
MIRGTFANPRIKNTIVGGAEGSLTRHFPDRQEMSVYDAAMKYKRENVPLLVIAGKGFGTGSSRDWAAKGQKLLGVKAAIAESFERIHRSNLIGMGVLPLQFEQGISASTLALDGSETLSVTGVNDALLNDSKARLVVTRKSGEKIEASLIVRLDSQIEREYYESGGILDYVLVKTLGPGKSK